MDGLDLRLMHRDRSCDFIIGRKQTTGPSLSTSWQRYRFRPDTLHPPVPARRESERSDADGRCYDDAGDSSELPRSVSDLGSAWGSTLLHDDPHVAGDEEHSEYLATESFPACAIKAYSKRELRSAPLERS